MVLNSNYQCFTKDQLGESDKGGCGGANFVHVPTAQFYLFLRYLHSKRLIIHTRYQLLLAANMRRVGKKVHACCIGSREVHAVVEGIAIQKLTNSVRFISPGAWE